MFDYNGLQTMVSTLGFPIMISLILIKTNNELTDDHREEIKEMRERYDETIDQFRKEMGGLNTAITDNTIAVTKLIQKIDNIQGGDNNGKSN